ncbi:hypothetical protein DPMN_031532 [Dreissena polymorpha]|uniref:Uncharacterized protein n=1 Tax=Dreissena polymorpha TaxID=45954 RepID=A0A9D4M055_DREPO|nr:hypothetical protein DPMN_031532 [Dreissena polymorpha]
MDVNEVVHVLRVPDAPTDIEATQAALLLHEKSGSGDTMDAVEADTQRQCLTLVAQSVPWSQKQKRRKFAD